MSKLSNVAYRSESAHKCTQGTEQCHGCRRMSGSYITHFLCSVRVNGVKRGVMMCRDTAKHYSAAEC